MELRRLGRSELLLPPVVLGAMWRGLQGDEAGRTRLLHEAMDLAPDDAEFHAGGLAVIYRQHDHVVKIVSLTNGDAGHHRQRGLELAARRLDEAKAAAAAIGADCEVWDYGDGQLEPTLERTRR